MGLSPFGAYPFDAEYAGFSIRGASPGIAGAGRRGRCRRVLCIGTQIGGNEARCLRFGHHPCDRFTVLRRCGGTGRRSIGKTSGNCRLLHFVGFRCQIDQRFCRSQIRPSQIARTIHQPNAARGIVGKKVSPISKEIRDCRSRLPRLELAAGQQTLSFCWVSAGAVTAGLTSDAVAAATKGINSVAPETIVAAKRALIDINAPRTKRFHSNLPISEISCQ